MPTFSPRERIKDAVLVTPCLESAALSDRYGFRIHCKMEYLQRTGSFKDAAPATPC
ncbi:MAG: hypothetical protein QM754_03420 [Tepidisphaeraceae bacterium]